MRGNPNARGLVGGGLTFGEHAAGGVVEGGQFRGDAAGRALLIDPPPEPLVTGGSDPDRKEGWLPPPLLTGKHFPVEVEQVSGLGPGERSPQHSFAASFGDCFSPHPAVGGIPSAQGLRCGRGTFSPTLLRQNHRRRRTPLRPKEHPGSGRGASGAPPAPAAAAASLCHDADLLKPHWFPLGASLILDPKFKSSLFEGE